MDEPQLFLDDILKKFPYNSSPNQFQKLTQYIISKGGGNSAKVKADTEMAHSTRRKVEASWNDLSREEQGFLLMQIGTQIIRSTD